MEHIEKLDWDCLVKRAVQRRKELGMSQERLATLAGISTPTLSRFENNAKDIQLSSALAILKALAFAK